MNAGPFKVLDRIDTDKIFSEWAEEGPFEDYEEPLTEWHVKNCKAYENGSAVVLFENNTGERAPYYRWYLYDIKESELHLARKLRIEPNNVRIENFGFDGLVLYACETFIDTGEHDVFSIYAGDEEVKEADSLDEIDLLDMSDEYFLVNSEQYIYLVKYPEEMQVIVTDEFNDLIDRWKSEAGEVWQDDDDDDDWDEEEESEIEVKAVPVPDNGKSGIEELNELIGLGNVKNQVNRIVSFAKMQKAMAAGGAAETKNINMNMVFSGAPGTAKTTVARIVAKILKENGILSKGNLVEVGRADLVAKYVGQTAPRVKNTFQEARGNLLFIDEAYSLVDSREGDYGDEAIATIVQEMENNRDNLVVIFAGYTDKMDEFISRNPGLRSRIPFVIKFDDYSSEELTQIASLEAKRKGFSIAPEAVGKIREICAVARENDEFGNGRFSRNLVENAIMNYAVRLYGGDGFGAKNENCVLIAEDFELPESMRKEVKRRTIGFCA